MEYEWYVDVFFLMNFFMDFAAVITAAVCCNRKIKTGRTMAACAITVLTAILLLMYLPNYLLYRLMVHIVLNPLMTFYVFRPGEWGQFLRLLLSIYLVIFLMGGIQESVRIQTGIRSNGQILICGIFAAVIFTVYMLRQKTLRHVCEVDLWLQDKKVSISAYWDSGNLLRDPGNGSPISIMDKSILDKWNVNNLETRKIPYHTISENQAYLDVITLDKMDIYLKGTVKQIKAPEIGLHSGKIMRRPSVQMLLHASYMSG